MSCPRFSRGKLQGDNPSLTAQWVLAGRASSRTDPVSGRRSAHQSPFLQRWMSRTPLVDGQGHPQLSGPRSCSPALPALLPALSASPWRAGHTSCPGSRL
jgi:hypothetical protein